MIALFIFNCQSVSKIIPNPEVKYCESWLSFEHETRSECLQGVSGLKQHIGPNQYIAFNLIWNNSFVFF